MSDLLLLAAVGGLLALDGTSVGQFMVSRPLAAGVITGLALGRPELGLLVGSVLELYLLVAFPTGGARFPEGPTATVVAVATAAAGTGPGAIALGVAAGLVWGQVGGFSITALRRYNGERVPEVGAPEERLDAVGRIHMQSVGVDFFRGAAVTALGVAAGRWGMALLGDGWPLSTADSVSLLLVGGAVSGGILLRSFGGFRQGALLLAAGLVVGLLGARFL